MTFDLEKAEHSQQDSFSVGKLAKELPFSIANGHKQERNDLSVSKVVMPSACPVPDVAPQYPVQFEESFLRAGMFVVVCPSGNDTVEIFDQNGRLCPPMLDNYTFEMLLSIRPFCPGSFTPQCYH